MITNGFEENGPEGGTADAVVGGVDRVGVLTPTARCNGAPPTPAQRQGPYYKPDTPLKADFRPDQEGGAPLVVHGRVVDTDGVPVAGALLDFWQVDDSGIYDDNGFRMRGHQFTAPDGTWRLDTVVPALYPGRTRHLHLKVQPPGGRVLTTMLYFPGERRNKLDKYFRAECLMEITRNGGEQEATIDIVVDTSLPAEPSPEPAETSY
ncbi:dioxygenase family protein [Kineosporia succinea]|uniref:Protocatechuate 3,4-dioxygenase beta subunit n=1 Tax=Kineosporia succinea TaxID=84632 RepID=A0ABT9NW70_9ACTN|nr:hypothetical protein [Kineosporia succinea]MDP9824399.1 protocatechuate 3,4-dioxygenase beta subunit [Kineosporia succinea]